MSSEKDESRLAEIARQRRAHFSPTQVDQAVRSALQMCWMLLPPERQNSEEVETQFRRVVDRALRDMKEDIDAFQ